jgi:hypothetical protein
MTGTIAVCSPQRPPSSTSASRSSGPKNEDPFLGCYVARERLARGLALVAQERDLARKTGWTYRKQRKTLALREIAWQKAVRFARERGALSMKRLAGVAARGDSIGRPRPRGAYSAEVSASRTLTTS